MNGLAQAAALISTVVYIAAAALELFFFNSPRVRALLHVEAQNVADVRMWAFCIGFRNTRLVVSAAASIISTRSRSESSAASSMVFDTKRTTVHDFAETATHRPAEPLQSRRDLGTPKWTPDLA